MKEELKKFISINDRVNLTRLERILKINIPPQIIIIGVQTLRLADLFKQYLTEMIKFDFVFDYSNPQNYQVHLRQYFKEYKQKSFLFILEFETSEKKISDNTQKAIHSLLIHRDLIIRNEHKIIILCNKHIYRTLHKQAYDLVSYANFNHVFHDITITQNIPTKIKETNIDYNDLINIYQNTKTLRHRGKFREALQILKKGLSLIENHKNFFNRETRLELKYDFYKGLAKTYFAQGVNALSVKFYDKVLAIHKQNPDIQPKTTIQIYIRQARALKELGNYEIAKKLYYEALEKARQQNYFKGVSMALGELMYLAMIENDYDRAMEYQKQRLNYYRQTFKNIDLLREIPEMGYVWRDMGNYYTNQGQVEHAMNNYQLAIEVFAKNSMHRNIAKIFLLWANLYYRFFQPAKAFSIYRKAFNIVKKYDILDIQVDTLNEISKIYHFRGNFSMALQTLIQANKIAKQNMYYKGLTKNLFYANYLFSSITTYQPEYMEFFHQLHNLNGIYKKADALKYKTFYLLAQIKYYLKTNPDKVIAIGEKALEMSKKSNHYENMTHAYYSMGLFFIKRNNYNRAKIFFERGKKIANEKNFILGRILNEFYYYKPEITPEIPTEKRIKKILEIKELAEDAEFSIFLPRIYELLSELFKNNETDKEFYQKKRQKIENTIRENLPTRKQLSLLLIQ